MILREILKKIRQIEIRTNRLVSETCADIFSFNAVDFDGIESRRSHHFLQLDK